MNWKDAFKLPLTLPYGEVKVFTSQGNMAFDFMFEFFKNMFDGKEIMVVSKETRQDILDLINGVKTGSVEGIVTYDEDQGTINIDDKPLLLIRGWGHLTGTGGGLGLDPQLAANLQDDFANHIVQKLSGK